MNSISMCLLPKQCQRNVRANRKLSIAVDIWRKKCENKLEELIELNIKESDEFHLIH